MQKARQSVKFAAISLRTRASRHRDLLRNIYKLTANGPGRCFRPLVMRATSSGVFAYVRIATFNVDERQESISTNSFALSQKLSQKGLILDVRGNGGGLIYFGERMLQLLTPRPIDPARFSFLKFRTDASFNNSARVHSALAQLYRPVGGNRCGVFAGFSSSPALTL